MCRNAQRGQSTNSGCEGIQQTAAAATTTSTTLQYANNDIVVRETDDIHPVRNSPRQFRHPYLHSTKHDDVTVAVAPAARRSSKH